MRTNGDQSANERLPLPWDMRDPYSLSRVVNYRLKPDGLRIQGGSICLIVLFRQISK
jgi:hypothetical protein